MSNPRIGTHNYDGIDDGPTGGYNNPQEPKRRHMTSPKRAEPGNEHAGNLREAADEVIYQQMFGGAKVADICRAAAAEIERLAARVRELEGKICLGCLYGAGPESKPDQETKE